jgi:hypothetical protein
MTRAAMSRYNTKNQCMVNDQFRDKIQGMGGDHDMWCLDEEYMLNDKNGTKPWIWAVTGI